jgi:phenylpropionate dioxygenase-like ring-hydroxylating dioxygenase large terminal subunit
LLGLGWLALGKLSDLLGTKIGRSLRANVTTRLRPKRSDAKRVYVSLESFWYVIGRSKDLRASAVAQRKLLGRSIALFRDRDGRARALLDACPHRGFPLSLGSCVDGALRCNYHGWRFAGDGKCSRVPGLAPTAPQVRPFAQAFATVEQNGFIWVWGRPGEAPTHQPLYLPLADESEYHSEGADHGVFGASVELILDNFMDSVHPAFVHPGLLNSDEKRSLIDLEVRPCNHSHEKGTWAGLECAYMNEPFGDFSLFVKLFGQRSKHIEHFERFFPPSFHQFEYRIGRKTHFVSTQFLCPEDDRHTRVLTLYHFRFWIPHVLAKWPFRWLFSHLLRQDKVCLEKLQEAREHLRDFHDASTQVDTFSLAVLRHRKRLAAGEPFDAVRSKPLQFQVEL